MRVADPRAMTSADNQKKIAALRFGPYITPVVAPGVVVECEVRGLVTIAGISDAPIAWPLGERDGERQPVVFKALARALRQEAPEAVAAAWGVTVRTVEAWRAACKHPRHRKKQTISSPPIPWKREDDELIASLSLSEAARLTGRTLTAVRKRRRTLGLPDGRMAAQRSIRTDEPLEAHAAAACRLLNIRTHQLADSVAELCETMRKAQSTLAFWRSRSRRAVLVNYWGDVLDATSTETKESPDPHDQYADDK